MASSDDLDWFLAPQLSGLHAATVQRALASAPNLYISPEFLFQQSFVFSSISGLM